MERTGRGKNFLIFALARGAIPARVSPFSMKYRTYLLLGAPGSGKGTQGKIIGAIPRFFHLAMGDVFRALDTRTPIGQKFIEYSSRGQLVPDEVTMELLRAHISHLVGIHSFKPDIDALVLDGVPRNVEQAIIMKDMIDVKKVFHLSCPDREQLVVRIRKRALKENRFDDANEETIRRRLATYEVESKPLLDYYGPDVVRTIDAQQEPVKVVKDIVSELI
jgi:adenylate kinase